MLTGGCWVPRLSLASTTTVVTTLSGEAGQGYILYHSVRKEAKQDLEVAILLLAGLVDTRDVSLSTTPTTNFAIDQCPRHCSESGTNTLSSLLYGENRPDYKVRQLGGQPRAVPRAVYDPVHKDK